MIKIAVIGSPGSGKTTLSTGLFYHFKTLQENVEMVPELIKFKVYKDQAFNSDGFDVQNTLEQREFEDSFNSAKAKAEIDYLICEAPLCNGFFYSSFYEKKLEFPILKKIAKDHINSYDIILFVERLPDTEFVTFGRKESLEQAKKLESHIKKNLKGLGYKNKILYVNQRTSIFEILHKIGVKLEKLEKIRK